MLASVSNPYQSVEFTVSNYEKKSLLLCRQAGSEEEKEKGSTSALYTKDNEDPMMIGRNTYQDNIL